MKRSFTWYVGLASAMWFVGRIMYWSTDSVEWAVVTQILCVVALVVHQRLVKAVDEARAEGTQN